MGGKESDEQLQIQKKKSWLLKSFQAWQRDMGLALRVLLSKTELVEVDPKLSL